MSDKQRIEALEAALKDIFALMDENKLVRSVRDDNDPLWALQALNFVRRLAKAKALIEATDK